MGDALMEVELAGSKEDAGSKLPAATESASVPLLSESSENENNHDADTSEFQKSLQSPAGKDSALLNGKPNQDVRCEEENPNTSNDSSTRTENGEDNQDQPLLSQQSRSDEVPGDRSSSNGSAIDGSVRYSPEILKEMEIKYAAYVRRDHYGNWGTKDVSLLEKLQMAVALVTLCPIRLLLLTAILVLFYAVCKLCTMRVIASSTDQGQESFAHVTGTRRTIIVHSGRICARLMLFVFGFYYIPVTDRTPERMQKLQLGVGDLGERKENDEGKEEPERPGAIVSNHVSYLDILYHMSTSFPSFVAKRSVARLPLVGLISKCLGCVYVQRESKSSDFKGVSGVVSERLQAAHCDANAPALLLFPEGTTTNGDYLLPFKTGAFRAHTPVKPVILRYPYERFSPAWDTISGVRHLFMLLCQFVNHLEVVQLPVYLPTEKECDDPKLYALNVRTLMADEGNLSMSDIGLYEKRIFHAALLGERFPTAPAPQGICHFYPQANGCVGNHAKYLEEQESLMA